MFGFKKKQEEATILEKVDQKLGSFEKHFAPFKLNVDSAIQTIKDLSGNDKKTKEKIIELEQDMADIRKNLATLQNTMDEFIAALQSVNTTRRDSNSKVETHDRVEEVSYER